jgi:hypothetical protein
MKTAFRKWWIKHLQNLIPFDAKNPEHQLIYAAFCTGYKIGKREERSK